MKTGGNDKYENTLALNCNILAEYTNRDRFTLWAGT